MWAHSSCILCFLTHVSLSLEATDRLAMGLAACSADARSSHAALGGHVQRYACSQARGRLMLECVHSSCILLLPHSRAFRLEVQSHSAEVALGRYLLAEAGDALVVTFMGTKQRRDLLTNANLILEPVWPEDVTAGPLPAVARSRSRGKVFLLVILCKRHACLLRHWGEGAGEQGRALNGTGRCHPTRIQHNFKEMQLTRGLCAGQAAPSAHRGFLNRARAVPIESLYDMACRQGRRLVLTGAPSGLSAAAPFEGLLRQLALPHAMSACRAVQCTHI